MKRSTGYTSLSSFFNRPTLKRCKGYRNINDAKRELEPKMVRSPKINNLSSLVQAPKICPTGYVAVFVSEFPEEKERREALAEKNRATPLDSSILKILEKIKWKKMNPIKSKMYIMENIYLDYGTSHLSDTMDFLERGRVVESQCFY